MATKRRALKSLDFKRDHITPDQELNNLIEEKAVQIKVNLIQETPPITEKEMIMSQAQQVAQTEVQTNKAVSTAKEEPGMLAKAGNFLSDHKWKIAAAVGVTAAATAAFVYREEIGSFISSKVSGESAGGDAFM
jgi:hypothetical protein